MQSQNQCLCRDGDFFKVFNRACLAITLWLTVITMAKDDKDNSVSNPDSSGVGVLQGLESVLQNSRSNLESTSTQEDLSSKSYELRLFQHESRSRSDEPISFGDLLDSMDNDQDNSNDYNDLPNKGRI